MPSPCLTVNAPLLLPRIHLQVICCSGARSTITADLSRVEEQGVSNLASAFLDAQVRQSAYLLFLCQSNFQQ